MLDRQIATALETLSIRYEALACEPHLADTAQFCAHYGVAPEEACNAIIVALKTEPRRYVACLVRSDTRLDVNHKVSAAVNFKRLSFAPAEETARLTGMLIGGVTLVGLPPDLPILIDTRVMQQPTVILGGGNRESKIRVAPAELLKLPNARVADIAVTAT
jgi:prolyl-tRNA editing enzyme YbaK/EbsC (Cys-tRNA(Pro) deacylase)